MLLAKRITSVAKAAAKDVGMNEGSISAKSFKMLFVTQNYESGMSAAESAVATGHESAGVNKRYRASLMSKSGGALLALDEVEGGPRFYHGGIEYGGGSVRNGGSAQEHSKTCRHDSLWGIRTAGGGRRGRPVYPSFPWALLVVVS